MPIQRYEIRDGFDNLIASRMDIEVATILLKALYANYYNELPLTYTIIRLDCKEYDDEQID